MTLEGNCDGVDELKREVDDLRRKIAELETARSARHAGVEFGGLAHDFNNLISAVMANISLAKQYAVAGDRIYERLEEAEKASSRAGELARRLLVLANDGMRAGNAESSPANMRETAGSRGNGRFPGKGRILVMEDEEIVRTAVGGMLREIGHEPVFAEDGEEALRVYAEAKESDKPFDAVMLDLTIKGGMGGMECMRNLLEIDPDVKAVVSSGYSEDPITENYLEFGFRAVLPKPYRKEDLSGTLLGLLRGVEGRS